ncbi:1-acyl-sn-glycerol-3-phosphate acyltransferase [Galbibacter sp.]|uniref:1-acyl-sn-glycerol-3-phosphate acyltransferase n=1 Tax=Galbibacter sp. TaxID=2918471 RepID=UPI003A90A5BF
MITIDDIRPYLDDEVNDALEKGLGHPMIQALLQFTFPDKSWDEIYELVRSCNSIQDFQSKIIYASVRMVIDKSSEGFTTSGFDKLDPNQTYLYISNHRDIILDTSLLNVALLDNGLVMTASAIGNNLVKKPFLMELAKLNRSFLIMRDLPPREMLKASKMVSQYIRDLLEKDDRSVWIAQREGRTKDGNDLTQQGVLKMIALAHNELSVMDYFKKLRIVPVSISYEFDPTDILKIPELMAKHHDIEYVKSNNEDFNSILKGATGHKKRIHITAGTVMEAELDSIGQSGETLNKQYQLLADVIDNKIHKNYHLWPSNYMAYDMLNKVDTFKDKYSEKEMRQFQRRIHRRVEDNNEIALQNFLLMYANPVVNQLNQEHAG